MPALEKNLIDKCLEKISKKYSDFPIFIESGTYYGETTKLASLLFNKIYSIELDLNLFNKNKELFKNNRNVVILQGDTLKILPQLLIKENSNIIFWLDGHNSGPGTAAGEIDFPALQECEIIDKMFLGKYGLILIDDVRMFGSGHAAQIDNSLIDISIDKIIEVFKNKQIIDYWVAPSIYDSKDRLIILIKNNV